MWIFIQIEIINFLIVDFGLAQIIIFITLMDVYTPKKFKVHSKEKGSKHG
jgi:hypothetical protein